jgi:hypothetical protein
MAFSQMRKHPPLVHDSHDEFLRLSQGDFNITTGRHLFSLGPPESTSQMPVLSGGSIGLWNHRHNEAYGHASRRALLSEIREVHRRRHANSSYLPIDKPRIAIRQISRNTDTRTILACLVPAEHALASGAHYISFKNYSPKHIAFTLGILGSVPFDWYARRWVELNVTFELLGPMPVPIYEPSSPRAGQLIEVVASLVSQVSGHEQFLKELEVRVQEVNRTDVELAFAELDALVSHLYGLSRSHVEHIFKTFHRGWDHSARLAQVLNFYDQLPEVKKP